MTRERSKPKEERPNTAAKALNECDGDLFPNIYALLKICATIPVTSCACERIKEVRVAENSFQHFPRL